MAQGSFSIVEEIGPARIFLADSVTYFADLQPNDVIVCGSHGGETAALFGAASGAKGLILNDAGGGKDDAGTRGLAAVEPYGVAAATIDYRSARIGNGADTWRSGVISRCNRWAREAGLKEGQLVPEAARILASWVAQRDRLRPETPADRPPIVIAEVPPRVLALDSASMVDQSSVGVIVVTGSHGGATGGRGVRAAVAAGFFNDAGVGKEEAGISRLPLMDQEGIPGGTVDRNTARIGDGWETYDTGVLSHVNETARRLGLKVGMSVRQAVETLVEKLKE